MPQQSQTTPADLLRDQIDLIALRVCERITATLTTPDEYSQLAPYVARYFDERKEQRRTAAKHDVQMAQPPGRMPFYNREEPK